MSNERWAAQVAFEREMANQHQPCDSCLMLPEVYDAMLVSGARTFSRAVDQAIARENAAFERTLCRKCAGSGSMYKVRDGERVGWEMSLCDRCKGTGRGTP